MKKILTAFALIALSAQSAHALEWQCGKFVRYRNGDPYIEFDPRDLTTIKLVGTTESVQDFLDGNQERLICVKGTFVQGYIGVMFTYAVKTAQ